MSRNVERIAQAYGRLCPDHGPRCAGKNALQLVPMNGMMAPRWAQPAVRVERAEPRMDVAAVQPGYW